MLMIILALVVLGIRGFTLMQVDRFPKVDFPFVSVLTVFPGASPEDVEDLVVKPIEDAVAGIPGVDYVQSIANEGVGLVVIAFVEGVDGNQAAIDVERQVAAIKGTLPEDATDPSIVKADINAIPIMNLILSGPQSQDELFKLAEDVVKPRLQSTKGVASISVAGGRKRIIAIKVDANKLAAYNLPIDVVNQAFVLNNMTFPIGTLDEGRLKSSVRSVGSFQSLHDIEDMVISGGPSPFGMGGGRPPLPGSDTGGLVYLKDVAVVEDTFEEASVLQRYNGQDTVALSIIKTTDANVIDVADAIKKRVEELNPQLPGGAKITVVSDDSQFVKNSVNAVLEDLVLAVLVTGLVMLFFLHTIRSTFIVLLAIPTSLFATFLVMWALGFSLNVLTLLALTLTIGILVDDSIVVLENIERHLKMKKPPDQAAIEGRREIGLAAIAITLTDVVVYVPVAFTSGLVGQFFRSYGITIATATLFSLFVSFTLTPMLAAYWMRAETDEAPPRRRALFRWLALPLKPIDWLWGQFIRLWEWGWGGLTNLYAATLRLALKNALTQTFVLLVAVAALVGAIFMTQFTVQVGPYTLKGLGLINFEFTPQEDDGQFRVSVKMPPGTTLAETDRAARQVEQIILREVPETVSILTRVGSGGAGNIFTGGFGSGSNSASISVRLLNKNDRQRGLVEIIDALRPVVAKIPDATVSVSAVSTLSGPGAAIDIQVYGEDPNVLIDLANQVEQIVRTTPNTVDVVNDGAVRAPETKIRLDRQRLSDLGLSPAQVAMTLRTAVNGSDVGDFAPEGESKIEINLRMNEETRRNLDTLLQMPIGYLQGKPILLEQVAEIERTLAPATINRYNRQRVLSVTSDVIGSNSGGIASQIEARIRSEMTFPPDYGFRFSGATEQQRQSFLDLGLALGLSILLIYMLLVALYQNFLHPFAIMFSLPMALIGIFGGLALTGNTLNIFSMLGIIMLTGIVTRNAILIIDFANQLQREEGMPRKKALVEAGRLRLRPIAMTTNALLFALLPVLLSTADGSESRQPLAAVLMGGSITSGLLTLILVPVIYNLLETASDITRKVLGWVVGSSPAPAPAPTDGGGEV